MSLIIREIKAKSILTKSGIPGVDYCINPYVGCSHGCRYCYATFMKKYTGHTEPWGSFVDVKINAPEILQKQLKRAKRGRVLISSVTDAYQPIESKYKLTRQCLEILLQSQFPVDILTKSPLVLRDTDLIKKFKDIEVGITITTNEEKIRPHVDSIIIDRMNYPSKTFTIYNRMNLSKWLDKDFIDDIIQRLKNGFAGKPVTTC